MSLILSKNVDDLSPRELHERLVDSIGLSKYSFVIIGKLLYYLKQDNRFLVAVGNGIDTFDDYISQPEIGLTRGEANRLIQIYEEFVVRLGVAEEYLAKMSIKNLHYLLPLIKGVPVGDPLADELIADAEHLSQKDFREKCYEIKNEVDNRTYEHFIFKRCIETGSLTKVHDFTSEDVDTMIQRYKNERNT